jgi:uncharacterized membrane protein YdbT with pleckstrin-like domain
VAFPRKLLNANEELVVDTRPHWSFMAGPALTLLVTVVVLILLNQAEAPDWLQVIMAVLTLVALGWFVVRYARWATTNFVVTSDRLIYRSGVLAKRGIEIPLERVNTVFSNQSITERMLRTGDLVIESGGERGSQHFSDIPRPMAVQSEIYRQIEDNQTRMYQPRQAAATPAAEPSVLDQIDRLADLRDRGVISSTEFEAKKAQLLDRL